MVEFMRSNLSQKQVVQRWVGSEVGMEVKEGKSVTDEEDTEDVELVVDLDISNKEALW